MLEIFFGLVLHCRIVIGTGTRSKKLKIFWSSDSKYLLKFGKQTENVLLIKCLQNFYSVALDQK